MPRVEADPPLVDHRTFKQRLLEPPTPTEIKVCAASAVVGLVYSFFLKPLVGPALNNFVEQLSSVLQH